MTARRTHGRPHHGARVVAILALVALAVSLTGCGDSRTDSSVSASAPVGAPDEESRPADRDEGAIALVLTDDGLAGVPVGTSTPSWVAAGALSAPDGSAVFRSRPVSGSGGDGYELLRIDPQTGAEEPIGRQVPGPAGVRVAAVEPGGGRVALVAPGDEEDSTRIIDFDTERGAPVRTPAFDGTLDPEAYSLDRTLMFAARIYEDRYHVHGLVLDTGEQWPTLGPDKTLEPEDMYGSVVQAALSPDRTQLATLYRDSVKPDHTAFVHLLALESGTTVCIDLHAPFGGAEPGRDALEWREDGTVAVGHRADDAADSITATFDPASIWSGDPQPHYHADARPDPAPPALPSGVIGTPGFRRFVAMAAVST